MQTATNHNTMPYLEKKGRKKAYGNGMYENDSAMKVCIMVHFICKLYLSKLNCYKTNKNILQARNKQFSVNQFILLQIVNTSIENYELW